MGTNRATSPTHPPLQQPPTRLHLPTSHVPPRVGTSRVAVLRRAIVFYFQWRARAQATASHLKTRRPTPPAVTGGHSRRRARTGAGTMAHGGPAAAPMETKGRSGRDHPLQVHSPPLHSFSCDPPALSRPSTLSAALCLDSPPALSSLRCACARGREPPATGAPLHLHSSDAVDIALLSRAPLATLPTHPQPRGALDSFADHKFVRLASGGYTVGTALPSGCVWHRPVHTRGPSVWLTTG